MQVHIRDFVGARVHMIGIGGSSMSGLAELLHRRGYLVSGSDRDDSHTARALREQGITVFVGHSSKNVTAADLVVYTAAIDPDNPELNAAQDQGIPLLKRATLLGQLMQGHEQAVGVCGTQGKTTTSAMLAQALIGADLNPTVHIGGSFDAMGGGTRIGSEAIFVAEADEFNASFLEMRPTVAVVLNIDLDHLDFYRDIHHIQQTFEAFAALLPENGHVVGNGDDPRVRQLMQGAHCRVASYGFEPHNDWRGVDLTLDEVGRPSLTVLHMGRPVAKLALQVMGIFNASNALGALAAAQVLGADIQKSAEALNAFASVRRRFEFTGTVDGVKLYHDYGHNPVKMSSALSVAKLQPHRKLWAVMQPHTYSRVKRLFEDYIHCCDDADEILVSDIYAAREKDPGDIHSGMLVEAMQAQGVNARLTPSFDDIEAYLRGHWQSGDLVLTLGCGNINLLNEQIQRNGDSR